MYSRPDEARARAACVAASGIVRHTRTSSSVVSGASGTSVASSGAQAASAQNNTSGRREDRIVGWRPRRGVARAHSHGAGRQQRLAETVSAWFLPLVLVVAIGATAWHWRAAGPAAGILAVCAVELAVSLVARASPPLAAAELRVPAGEAAWLCVPRA